MGTQTVQTRGSGRAVPVKRIWSVWHAGRIKASSGSSSDAGTFIGIILFTLQGGSGGALLLLAEQLCDGQQQFHHKGEQLHLMVLPVWLVCTDQSALASETRAVTTAS